MRRIIKVFLAAVGFVIFMVIMLASGTMTLCSLDHKCEKPPLPLAITLPIGAICIVGLVTVLFYESGMFDKKNR